MAHLKILRGSEPGREFDLEGDRWVVGRSPECDVVIDVAAVSRRHVILTDESPKGGPSQFFVKDLGSRNGTYINDQRVAERAPIRDGDRMLICDVLFAFFDPRDRNADEAASREGVGIAAASLLGPRDEHWDSGESSSTVMATIDVGNAGTISWKLSAKPEAQIEAMVEISNNLRNTLSLQEILPKLLDSLFKIFVQADRGFIVMRPRPDAPLVPVASKARRPDDEANMRMSRTIAEQAMTGKKAILSADASSDERFNMAESITDFQIRSLICAPLISSEGEAIGVLQIDTRDHLSRFTDLDLHMLAGVASQASIAIDNANLHEEAIKQRALQRDLEVASQMQHALLPASSPDLPDYHFFEFYEAALRVGGDYYDYVLLSEGRFAVVVGDVAGKGVSAAILMAKLSSDVRFWLAREPDAAKALGEINAAFSRHDWDDRFVTIVVAVVDPSTHTLTLVNAGHMPPLLRNAAGEVLEIGGEEAGFPIGVIDDYQYEAYTRQLEPGDFVTIFTDGFSEAMNPDRELYGLERLIEVVGHREVGFDDLGQHVLDDVRQFAGDFPQSDDMCLVCFGRK
ncbi:MAG: SpoIIE family protein phosphatase [Planctomycetes bacterium]|nr:SpoIIE family protein phosphatase [Planctomycetota bacterium]